eukprot:gene9173-12371_t
MPSTEYNSTLNIDDVFGWESNGFTSNEHIVTSEYLLIFTVLLVIAITIANISHSKYNISVIPESGIMMIMGMIFGGILRIGMPNASTTDLFDPWSKFGFNQSIFYFVFLPPVIFNSGYHLRRKLLFNNIYGICSLAFIGTCIAATITSLGIYWAIHTFPAFHDFRSLTLMECVAFGLLLSSTDPVATLAIYSSLKVDPTLFYLVFGESVLNDAIVITIFKVTTKYIGYSMSYYDIITYFINFFILLVGSFVIGYGSGVSCVLSRIELKHVQFSFAVIGLCIVSRAVHVYPLLSLVNWFHLNSKKSKYFSSYSYLQPTASKIYGYNNNLSSPTMATHDTFPLSYVYNDYITLPTMHMVFLAGLRGAVAFALAANFPNIYGNRELVVITTIIVILSSIFGIGAFTKHALVALKIRMNVSPSEVIESMEVFPHHQHIQSCSNVERSFIYPIVIRDYKHNSHNNHNNQNQCITDLSNHTIKETQDEKNNTYNAMTTKSTLTIDCQSHNRTTNNLNTIDSLEMNDYDFKSKLKSVRMFDGVSSDGGSIVGKNDMNNFNKSP